MDTEIYIVSYRCREAEYDYDYHFSTLEKAKSFVSKHYKYALESLEYSKKQVEKDREFYKDKNKHNIIGEKLRFEPSKVEPLENGGFKYLVWTCDFNKYNVDYSYSIKRTTIKDVIQLDKY